MAAIEGSGFGGRHGLGQVREMAAFREFVDSQQPLTNGERATLVDQAEILVRDLYVHLPLKRAMHAVDPEQRLRLLRQRSAGATDREFHSEFLEIITGLRDLHTNYVLPDPYRGQIAFLGVLLERYFEDGQPRCMISKVAEHLATDATLIEGALVTHWNGTPIELAVWRNAAREAGSNRAARIARGMENMTLRVLATSLPPDEDWVDLRYEVAGGTHETRLLWRVFEGVREIVADAPDPSGLVEDMQTPLRYQVAVDARTEEARRAKKSLFSGKAVQEEERVAKYDGVPRTTAALKAAGLIVTSRPDDLTAKIVSTSDGDFGYLRLWTFHMKDGEIGEFVGEVARLVEFEMPPEGLIIDVRGNGGGYVIAAEFLLQLFTPRRIEPEPAQFINSPANASLTRHVESMKPWNTSIKQAVETGATYSTAIPLSDPDLVNMVGQLYYGPVVLITDAFCYSACDMFAAGFQDHDIGTIIGVDPNTGAGGANVLGHSDLRTMWPNGPLKALPKGAQMRVSLRRTLRVGARAGEPVEDLGVRPDIDYEMRRRDLLEGNRDLLDAAGAELAKGKVRSLAARVVAGADPTDPDLQLEVTTGNISEVDVYVDGRPKRQAKTSDSAPTTIAVPFSRSVERIRIEGFDRGTHVASRLLRFQT
ncbi:MAG: peptidase S41 [Ilumatobacter sp.]|nr:peptidase S41 [Ilumatobacter sp.]